MMQYSIQNNGQGSVMIRIIAPEGLALAFLSFIEQKKRENGPSIKSVSCNQHENYFMELSLMACNLFDKSVSAGASIKSALSETNYALKAHGFANVSYEITKKILQKSGKFRLKIQ